MANPREHRRSLGISHLSGIRRWVMIAAAVWVMGTWQVTYADAVKLGGFWIGGVSVQRVANGQVYYIIDSTGLEFSRRLSLLEGLKLTAYPQLAKAEQALDRADDTAALQALLQVRRMTREPWLIQWVSYRLVGVYDRLKMPAEAVEVFLQLVRESAPTKYLITPPIESVQQADPQVKIDLHQRLEAAKMSLAGQPQIQVITPLLDASVTSDQATMAQAPAQAVDTTPDKRLPTPTVNPVGATLEVAAPETGAVLARSLDRSDPVTQKLSSGNYEQAMALLDKVFSGTPSRLSMRLYQRGMAQLGLAEATQDRDLYMDAGLSFMRVAIHFPNSTYIGPSTVEAGFVHSKIGRPDLARQLYDEASVWIDAQSAPRYAARLNRLSEMLGE